jgi:hypothetical protein
MPHITATGCHTERQVAQINIHAEVVFSQTAWADHKKCYHKMKEIQERIEAMLMEYFDMSEVGSETYTNHEYNSRMSNF